MKKVLLILIILFPIVVHGTCNTEKNNEYIKTLAPQITYDNVYDRNSRRFSFIIYNVPRGFFVTTDSGKFYPDSENKVVFNGLNQGSNISVSVYASSECEAIKYIGFTEGYFNPYYNSYDCLGYEDKISYCSQEFTSTPVTKEIIELAKYYSETSFVQEEEKEEVKELSFLDLLKIYISKWWVKVLLAVLTTIISISLYSTKLRKIKHGI